MSLKKNQKLLMFRQRLNAALKTNRWLIVMFAFVLFLGSDPGPFTYKNVLYILGVLISCLMYTRDRKRHIK